MPTRLNVTPEALLQGLFPDRPELLRDRELMGSVRDCIDVVQNEVAIGKIGPRRVMKRLGRERKKERLDIWNIWRCALTQPLCRQKRLVK